MLCDYDYDYGVVGDDVVVVFQCKTWQKLVGIMFPLRNRDTWGNKIQFCIYISLYTHRESKKISEFSLDEK